MLKKSYKRFGYSGLGVETEFGLIVPKGHICGTSVNKSSVLIDVIFDNEKEEFMLFYYDAGEHFDELDKYKIYYIFEKDLTDKIYDELVGYTFYGRFYIKCHDEYKLVFIRHDGTLKL